MCNCVRILPPEVVEALSNLTGPRKPPARQSTFAERVQIGMDDDGSPYRVEGAGHEPREHRQTD